MKLLILADIHGCLDNLDYIDAAIRECDGVVIAGDITDFGGDRQAGQILSALGQYKKPLLAVPGNCDLAGVDKVLCQKGVGVHGTCVALNGLQFVGVGGSLPCPGATPNEAGEETFHRVLQNAVVDLASKDNFVLVTHQPAWGTDLDTTGNGRHTGSQAVREFIERYQPILAISGHMHEAYGTDRLGATTLVNPGPFRQGRYAVVEIAEKQVQVQLFP